MASSEIQPLDSYRERGAFGARSIELFDDKVVVTGHRSFGGGDFSIIVPLETLEPTVNRLGIHEQTRLIGCAVFLVGGIAALSWLSRPPIYSNLGFWVCSILASFGLILLLRSFRRIEAAAFFTTAGIHRLTVAQCGPDAGRFQDFVERISSQIALTRAGTHTQQ